jgi:RHS repeat-associated protein
VRVSSQPCNGTNLSPAYHADFFIMPAQGVAIRFHYRDLLGSSALSRLYSPRLDGSEPGATIELDLASGPMTLYPHPAERTFYEPFGNPITATTGEARYTDHERDQNSGFNYMKGRYQLPEQYVFNRPDPKRDWDWLRPRTINLYKFTSNDPINAWDPDGYTLCDTPVTPKVPTSSRGLRDGCNSNWGTPADLPQPPRQTCGQTNQNLTAEIPVA